MITHLLKISSSVVSCLNCDISNTCVRSQLIHVNSNDSFIPSNLTCAVEKNSSAMNIKWKTSQILMLKHVYSLQLKKKIHYHSLMGTLYRLGGVHN